MKNTHQNIGRKIRTKERLWRRQWCPGAPPRGTLIPPSQHVSPEHNATCKIMKLRENKGESYLPARRERTRVVAAAILGRQGVRRGRGVNSWSPMTSRSRDLLWNGVYVLTLEDASYIYLEIYLFKSKIEGEVKWFAQRGERRRDGAKQLTGTCFGTEYLHS